MPVEHEDPLIGIADHAHQDPLGAMGVPGVSGVSGVIGIPGVSGVPGVSGAREGDLDGAIAAAGAMPDLRGKVDAELGDRGLGGHGFLATPQ